MNVLKNATKIVFGSSLDGVLQGEPKRGAILISHGAGGTMDTSLLVQTADQLAERGFLTMRWNFGYVKPRRAPSAGGKRERPEMITAIEYLIERLKSSGAPSRIILIGKSFGGRVSTYLPELRPELGNDVEGFVFYGLPIQGITPNAEARDWTHVGDLPGRALFITGDKDKLCPLEQLQYVQSHLKIPFDSHVVPGDHSYKPRGEKEALKLCVEWVDKNFT